MTPPQKYPSVEIKVPYISNIDRPVVCVYPLLGSHVVERSCGGNRLCPLLLHMQHRERAVYMSHAR